MSPSKIINTAGDWIVERTATQWKVAGIVAFVGIALAFIAKHDAEQRAIGYRQATDSAQARTIAKLAHIRDSIGARIDTQTITLTKTLKRVDTLWAGLPIDPVTAADTARIIDALPVLRRSTDSAIHACSEFQVSCAEYRRVADSLELALRGQITVLKSQINAEKPSKVRRVVTWAAILGAGYVGYRAGKR